MGGIYEEDGLVYFANLGTANTDSLGNWSFAFTVPATITRESDGAEIDIFPAYWPVGGVYIEPDSTFYASWSDPDLLVYGERPPVEDTSTPAATNESGTYYGARLPETGSSALPIGLALLATGFACAAAIPLLFRMTKDRGEPAACSQRALRKNGPG